MSLSTFNFHPSSSTINLFCNNNNYSPKPFPNSLGFSTSSTSSSSFVAPLKFSTTNHALSSSNRTQRPQLWLRCVSTESEPSSTSAVPGGSEERIVVLVIGGGGREHALCHALKRSPSCNSVLCAPGNPGITTSGDAACVPDLDVSDSSAVISFCRKRNVGLVVVGPEVPLVAGLANDLVKAGILTFGPSSQAAALEGSKNFMKNLCHKYNIPTAKYKTFSDASAAKEYIKEQGVPIVIKADGLAAGKGVTVAMELDEAYEAVDSMLVEGVFGSAGCQVIVEEFLEGEEASFFALVDGENAIPLESAQDHKRVGDGDTGPNTGGMGAYSPAPVLTKELQDVVMETIIHPTVRGMAEEGCKFVGVLFAGLMIEKKSGLPKLIEFNVRFGDPECQVLMMRLESDLAKVLLAACKGELSGVSLDWSKDSAMVVVMASKGYPGAYEKGTIIRNLEEAERVAPGVKVFHAGTDVDAEGNVVGSGGRVLGVTAMGKDLEEARERAYLAAASPLPLIKTSRSLYKTYSPSLSSTFVDSQLPSRAMAAEKLLDLSQPIDVALLDATVGAFYSTGSKDERAAADNILRELKANPDTWLQVVHILQSTRSTHTKYFALQVLEGVIKYRWNALPVEQRDGMKNYISEVIVQLSGDEGSFRSERLYVNKLNVILVQIVKHEWPGKWRSFIPDLVKAAKTSETICENCMAILKLLSEEVFDFSRGEMTQQKIKELKESLNSEFLLIHELCLYVLSASKRPELIRATLSALHAYLSWIPLGYIFESPLLETLLKFFPEPAYRNLALQCLSEVAALDCGDFYNGQYVKMYSIFMGQLQAMLPLDINIPEAYSNGSDEEQAFIQNLALFFTSFFKSHIKVLESAPEIVSLLLVGLGYLINISYVDDTEVFKVCLDYWNSLVSELFTLHHHVGHPGLTPSLFGLQMACLPRTAGSIKPEVTERQKLYADPLSKLRGLMISRMAKPEEVIIVEDENGNIVRETMKDNDVLVQYKIMRETLIYLSHLGHEDTERQMLSKLSKQLSGEEWTWNNLNTLCWAIGSISGSMDVDQENRFLVMVIRDLLSLCEIIKGKDNKAVIASNIMYVVGQYSRFLRAHWKFLKTVVHKLFEFMHETHPGVQDMACDTFLKIVQKCRRKFVVLQVGEKEPFVSELLSGLVTIVGDLEPHQIHTFYESVGSMILSETDPQKRSEYIQRLMDLPNQKWTEIIGQARQNADILKDPDMIRTVLSILQTNTRVATSLGTYFLSQISLIFLDMLNVYRMYSELVSSNIAEGGPYASRTSVVKLLRSVKREILKLIETFLDKAEYQPHIGKQFVPPMMDPVLGDYARNVPDARESEVLSLFATIINKYKVNMQDEVPRIFEVVFQCTLEMITKNFEDYPEHRLKFFSLLRAIATYCFPALVQLSSEQLKLVMDSVIWAFRHTERNIAETGLNLLLELLKKFQKSDFSNQFYRTYFMQIEQEIFAVLTDTFHKPGFKLHVLVLQHLFSLVESKSLTEPLWDASTVLQPYPNNAAFVLEYTIKLLSSSFPNMTTSEVTQFVNGLYESRSDIARFKENIRDFLVQSKEFSAQDNKDLYAEEAAAQIERDIQKMLLVPGLVAPNEIQDDMADS